MRSSTLQSMAPRDEHKECCDSAYILGDGGQKATDRAHRHRHFFAGLNGPDPTLMLQVVCDSTER